MELIDISGKPVPERFAASIELVAERLSPIPEVLSILLCGSAARGWVDDYSDLDIHVVCESIPSESARRKAYAGFGPPLALSTLKVTEDFSCDDEFDIHQGGDRTPVCVDFETYHSASQWAKRFANIGDLSEEGLHAASLLQDGIIVFDSGGLLNSLRSKIHPMPDEIRRILVTRSVDRMTDGYEMECTRKGALRGDIFTFYHHLTELIARTARVCLSLNGKYYPGDKNLREHLSYCDILPDHCIQRLTGIISDPDHTSAFQQWLCLAQEVVESVSDFILDDGREVALKELEWISKPDWRP